MADVNGICVRKQGEAVALGQFFKESVVVNRSGIKCAVPDFGKLLKAEPAAKPLSQMKQLEAVILPKQFKDVEFLRNHPSLKRISYKKLTETKESFWAAFDAAPQKPAPPQ